MEQEYLKYFEDEEIGTANTLSQRKSNARLIAAAPDLLEAVHCLLGVIVSAKKDGRLDVYSKESYSITYSHAIEVSRAAIAKVEGNYARGIKQSY